MMEGELRIFFMGETGLHRENKVLLLFFVNMINNFTLNLGKGMVRKKNFIELGPDCIFYFFTSHFVLHKQLKLPI